MFAIPVIVRSGTTAGPFEPAAKWTSCGWLPFDDGSAAVLLPAALWTESEGVMVNCERNLSLFQPAVDAPVRQRLARRDSQRRAHLVIERVGYRHDCIQAIVSAGHLYNDQRAFGCGLREVRALSGQRFRGGDAATENRRHDHSCRYYQQAIFYQRSARKSHGYYLFYSMEEEEVRCEDTSRSGRGIASPCIPSILIQLVLR